MTYRTLGRERAVCHVGFSISAGPLAVQGAGETWTTIWGAREDE